MRNWKTTVSGVFAALGQVAPLFGVPAEVGHAVSVLGMFLLGLFAKDYNNHGV